MSRSKTWALALVALAFVMAIPPPHVFINVTTAKMRDARTLEVTFDHPTCDDPESIGTDVYWAAYDEKANPGKDYKEYSFSLQELRKEHGVAACKGPVKTQTLAVDLSRLITDAGVTRGRIHFNYEPLYGYMKEKDAFSIPFDFTK